MESARHNHRRGRPVSESDGAAEAFDAIEKYRKDNKLSKNALAVKLCMTPSTVGRALKDRATARWSPTFKAIYSIAVNDPSESAADSVVQRLAAYRGPAKTVVQRILSDVDELVTTLSTSSK